MSESSLAAKYYKNSKLFFSFEKEFNGTKIGDDYPGNIDWEIQFSFCLSLSN